MSGIEHRRVVYRATAAARHDRAHHAQVHFRAAACPKHRSRRHSKSPKWLAPFVCLDLKDLSKETGGPNHFMIEVLRRLYGSGFAGWLAEKKGNAAFLAGAMNEARKLEQFASTA